MNGVYMESGKPKCIHPCAYNKSAARCQQSLTEKPDAINSMRRELPLAPGILLREANRRRASLSAGNILELMDSNRNSFKEGLGNLHILLYSLEYMYRAHR